MITGKLRQEPNTAIGTWVVVGMIVVLIVPVVVTLMTVQEPRTIVDPATDPTPLGYTWSLLLFIVPMLVIAWWFLRHPLYQFQKKAFLITLALLVPLGFVLDFLFGRIFFTFPNQAATLGIEVPAVGGDIPIEEFVFYLTGFAVVLLLYVWGDEFWVAAYNIEDYRQESENVPRLLRFHAKSLLVGAILIALAVLYKRLFAADPVGLPWYWIYLVVASVVPSVGLFRSVAPFINWRAFSITFFFMLLVSLLWEATLGVPYAWWGYNPEAMMGIFIKGWTDLPIEATFVWLAVSYSSVIIFEAVKIYLACGRSLKDALFGCS